MAKRTSKPAKSAKAPEPDAQGLIHHGGGWYELPDGSRVRGRAKALEAQRSSENLPAATTVADTVRHLVAALEIPPDARGHRRRALAAQAVALAEVLDMSLIDPRSAAPTSRELRAVLDELVGDHDQAEDSFQKWEAQFADAE